MKIKTSELTGPQLDWAVAQCEGVGFVVQRSELLERGFLPAPYSTNPAYGHPIIERERITVFIGWPDEQPLASIWTFLGRTGTARFKCRGPTSLIAAMRTYVTFKLGESVEIPDSLNPTQPTP